MSGSGYSFLLRPKWIAFHLLVFGSIALMIWLAFWQLDRLDAAPCLQRPRLRRRSISRRSPLDQVSPRRATIPSRSSGARSSSPGTYLPDQVLWFNRSQDGLAGDNVLTALTTDTSTPHQHRDRQPRLRPARLRVPAAPDRRRRRAGTGPSAAGAPARRVDRRQRRRRAGHRGPPHRPRPARGAAPRRVRARLSRPDRCDPADRPGRPRSGAGTDPRRRTPPVLRSPVVHLRNVCAHRLGARRAPVDPDAATRGAQGRNSRVSDAGFRPARRRRSCQLDDRNSAPSPH